MSLRKWLVPAVKQGEFSHEITNVIEEVDSDHTDNELDIEI